MAGFLKFLPMLIAQQIGPQKLQRKQEPRQVTDAFENVVEYDRVMTTKLAIPYAVGLEVVHRARLDATGGSAVDLACGPGHYTLCLARYLGYDTVLGIDLSPRMVELATQNATKHPLEGRVRFCVGDITNLDTVAIGKFELTSFTGAAHHLANVETVAHVLRQMDQITKPEGLVMVMDLARLRTANLTERYINTLGKDYLERGLGHFLEDFRNTMYAVWTPRELRTAIPADSARWWCHLVPRGLPTVQIILGLPIGRSKVFVRPGFVTGEHPLIREWYARWESEVGLAWTKETLKEWKMMRLTLMMASKRMFPPGKA